MAALDDDCEIDSSFTWSVEDDGEYTLGQAQWELLTISVRSRAVAGYDPSGNPIWQWADVLTESAVLAGSSRQEIDDVAGTVKVEATVVVPYPSTSAAITETSAARTSDGVVWRITRAVRAGDTYTLTLDRDVAPAETMDRI